jgi:hypothetical protein
MVQPGASFKLSDLAWPNSKLIIAPIALSLSPYPGRQISFDFLNPFSNKFCWNAENKGVDVMAKWCVLTM